MRPRRVRGVLAISPAPRGQPQGLGNSPARPRNRRTASEQPHHQPHAEANAEARRRAVD